MFLYSRVYPMVYPWRPQGRYSRGYTHGDPRVGIPEDKPKKTCTWGIGPYIGESTIV